MGSTWSSTDTPTNTNSSAKLARMPNSSGSCVVNRRSNLSGYHHAMRRTTKSAIARMANSAGTRRRSQPKPLFTHTPKITIEAADKNSARTAVTMVS